MAGEIGLAVGALRTIRFAMQIGQIEETGTVIIGPHGDMDYWNYIGMVGQLSQPIGARRLVFISDSQGVSGQIELSEVRYIIWDDSLPLPTALAALAKSITPAWHYLVLSLP